MKILIYMIRSIAAILFGLILAVGVITAAETMNSIAYQPNDGRSFMEWMEDVQKDKKAMKEYIESVPESANVVVLLGWEIGAFLGGGLAALIAGFWRRLHASVIGAAILAATAFNLHHLRSEFDISHPDYLIVLGLLLPIPASLLGGQLVHWMFSPKSDSTVPPP